MKNPNNKIAICANIRKTSKILKFSLVITLVLARLATASDDIDSIEIPKTGSEIKRLNSGYSIDVHVNKIDYSEKTNKYIKDHFGPAFKVGGHMNNVFIAAFFKPWTEELQNSINNGQDTVLQYESINPIRTGFELGYSLNFKYLDADPYVGINWFILSAGKTKEKKKVDFNSSKLMSCGLNLKVPVFNTGIKTEDGFLKLGSFNVIAGAEYLIGDQSNTYSSFGKNAVAYSFGIQYKMYNYDEIFKKDKKSNGTN